MVLIFNGTVGLQLIVLTGQDLSSATLKALKVVKPDNTTASWVPTCPTPSNGQLLYTTVSGDIDEVGDYFLQAYVEFPGSKFWGDIVKFRVTQRKVT
jgi:hypothetical protein